MNPLNPFQDNTRTQFFGKMLQGFISQRKKARPHGYSRYKEKMIATRRRRNKAARKSRRLNQIIKYNLHHRFRPC